MIIGEARAVDALWRAAQDGLPPPREDRPGQPVFAIDEPPPPGESGLRPAKSDDLETGGHILSRDLRDQALASPDPDIRALADLKGELPNSAAASKAGAAGLAYVDGDLTSACR
jgi:hypothetical protein